MLVIPNINNGVSIEFKNVSFKYPNTDVYILKKHKYNNSFRRALINSRKKRCRKNNTVTSAFGAVPAGQRSVMIFDSRYDTQESRFTTA